MNSADLFNIHRKMHDSNVILAYTGELNMKVINALISSVKIKLKEVLHLPHVQKRVYRVMVETLEAILLTRNNTQKQTIQINPFAIFTLSFKNGYYCITSGKYVFNDMIEMQQEKNR